MSSRLNLLAERISGKKTKIGDPSKIVSSCFDFLSLADYLTPEENVHKKIKVEIKISHSRLCRAGDYYKDRSLHIKIRICCLCDSFAQGKRVR
jgi:hypothetical protein